MTPPRMRDSSRYWVPILFATLWLVMGLVVVSQAADQVTEFHGSVLTVDVAAKKLVVKKDSGGTRFTFVTSDTTVYEGVKTFGDLKKDDHVAVTFVVTGSQYLAHKVVKK